MPKTCLNQLTLFAGDSRAKTSQPPGNRPGSPGNGADCGESLQGSSENASQITQLSKTWRTCEVKDLSLSCKICGRSGMMRNGTLYQLAPLVPHINGKEYGLLPTVTACEWKGRGPNSKQQGLTNVLGVTGRELNPELCEWMMGFPLKFTEAE